MIKKTCGALALSLLLGMTSCSDDTFWEGETGHGSIALSIERNSSVKDAVPQTRAEGSDLFTVPDVKDFKIHLKKADGSTHTHLFHDEFVTNI